MLLTVGTLLKGIARHSESKLKQVHYVKTVGMPNGRISFFPGLGIQTRRVEFALPSISRLLVSLMRCLLSRLFTPSMPAVFLPLFSWVVLRTARSLAYQDLTNIF